MIPGFVYDKIIELHRGGWSQRAIAVAAGVTTTTVGRVIRGTVQRRPDDDEHKVVRVYRCEGCGNLVWLRPCVICESLT